ncbi:MAG: PAS domain S-box protein [Nitrospira sp.]|nr:PAS domain S-box protein [Nitrospira sp.]
MTSLGSRWRRYRSTPFHGGWTAWSWHALSAVSLLGTAALDVLTPLTPVGGAGYVLAVLAAGMIPSSGAPWVVAIAATGFAGLGADWSSIGGVAWTQFFSCGISVGAVWLAAWIVAQWQATSRSRAYALSSRLQSLLTNSYTIIFVKDLDGRFLEVSDQFAGLLGLPADAVIGKTDHDFFPAEFADSYRQHDAEVVTAGTAMNFEEAALVHGSLRWYVARKFPFRDETGRIIAVGGVATDMTARLLAEADRHEAQERLDLVVGATQTGIWDWDLQTNRMYYSSLWKATLGYEEEEISDSPGEWESRLHPEDHARIMALVDDYLSGRSASYELEHRLRHKDGAYRWVYTVAVLQRDADGRPRRMTGSHVDITTRKQAEQALAQSEGTLRSFFDSGVLMMGIVEVVDGDILHISDNRRVASFFGTTPERMQGRRASEMGVPAEVIQLWIRHYEESACTSQPVRFTYVHRDPCSGSELYLSATVCWIGAGSVGPSRYSYLVEDVSESRRLEVTLRDTAERYRGVVAALAEGVLVHDVQGRIIACNPSAERILGLTADQLMGRTPVDPGWQAIHPDGRPFEDDQRPPSVTLRTGRPCTEVVMGLCRPTGELRWVSINTQALTEPGRERPYGVVGSFHDITERRRAEQALLEAQSELERRVQERTARIQELESQRSQTEKFAALGHLAAGIAHEVNNPLAGITNAFHLVKQGIDRDHRHYRFVELIDREIHRLTAIVKKMYTLYQGVPAGKREATDIAALLQDLTVLLGHKLASKRVRLRTAVEIVRECVDVPRSDLLQVLLNLVQNAIDASSPDSEVLLRVVEEDGQLRWTVTDQGTGIPPHILPRVFEPFFTTKIGSSWQGLGLGLSVSRGLVEAMGGRIDIQTTVQCGSTVTVVHPLTAGDGIERGGASPPMRKGQQDDDYAATHSHC